MKKIFAVVSLLAVVFLTFGGVASAQYSGVQQVPEARDLHAWMQTVNIIARWIYTIVLVAAVILGLIAAFSYITAAGDSNKVKTANKMLIYAVIAVVIAILAFSITKIVGGLLGTSV
ncbi:MAG TPA: hypothetical protein PLR11_01205 [Candidatus Paceibacterota bacterium]|nr:hypothetical protein [Candidatus Paceibacterota bacterium]